MDCINSVVFSISFNDDIYGFFKGGRGLRQVDPISSLIFVLVMEYLTRLIRINSRNSKFRFHPMCKELKLTNIHFADDLFLFCKGNVESINCLMNAFKEFSDATGLSANMHKSNVYFGGVSENTGRDILAITSFQYGSFPMKYFGVPLPPTRWNASVCNSHIDKINCKN